MNQIQNQDLDQTQDSVQERKCRRDDYKGNPLLVLPLGENREFALGVGKARTILEFLDDVHAFVAENTVSQPSH